jgi:hypothetical protein
VWLKATRVIEAVDRGVRCVITDMRHPADLAHLRGLFDPKYNGDPDSYCDLHMRAYYLWNEAAEERMLSTKAAKEAAGERYTDGDITPDDCDGAVNWKRDATCLWSAITVAEKLCGTHCAHDLPLAPIREWMKKVAPNFDPACGGADTGFKPACDRVVERITALAGAAV